MRILHSLFFVSVVFIPAVAQAAEPRALVSGITGTAFIKTAHGATEASIGDVLSPGQEIVVGLDSTANLITGDCPVALTPGTSYTVPSSPPCIDGALVEVGAAAIEPANGGAPLVTGGGLSTTTTVIAGTAVAGGLMAGAMYYSIQSNKDETDPVSVP